MSAKEQCQHAVDFSCNQGSKGEKCCDLVVCGMIRGEEGLKGDIFRGRMLDSGVGGFVWLILFWAQILRLRSG